VRAVMTLLAVASVAAFGPASAQQAFRCTDAQGRVTYQESPCPSSATERKVDTTPANTDFDPSQRERVLKQGEDAQRRLDERAARDEAERKRRQEEREREEKREREAREREEARESAVIYYGPGVYRPAVPPVRPVPPRPSVPTTKPAPAPR